MNSFMRMKDVHDNIKKKIVIIFENILGSTSSEILSAVNDCININEIITDLKWKLFHNDSFVDAIIDRIFYGTVSDLKKIIHKHLCGTPVGLRHRIFRLIDEIRHETITNYNNACTNLNKKESIEIYMLDQWRQGIFFMHLCMCMNF